jgi:hypothetical protein
MKKLICVLPLCFILLVSCSSTQTVIKDKKIDVVEPKTTFTNLLPPTVHVIPTPVIKNTDTLNKTAPDSSYVETVLLPVDNGDNTKQNIKNIDVKYYPKLNKFVATVPQRTQTVTYTDTTKYTAKSVPFSQKTGYAFIGIIIFVVLGIAVYLIFFKFKVVKL